MGGNVGANNAAISAILLFVLASRTRALGIYRRLSRSTGHTEPP